MWTFSLSARPCAHTVLWPLHMMWLRVRKNQGEGFPGKKEEFRRSRNFYFTHTYTHSHTYLCSYTHTICMLHICAHVCTAHICTHAHIYAHTQTHIYTHAHECTHVRSPHTYLPTYMHTSTQRTLSSHRLAAGKSITAPCAPHSPPCISANVF